MLSRFCLRRASLRLAATSSHHRRLPLHRTKFAVVRHGQAYQDAIEGLHGQQLSLAQKEGEGKDDPDFDPFLEEELEEARLIAEAEAAAASGAGESDAVDESGGAGEDMGEKTADVETSVAEEEDTKDNPSKKDDSLPPIVAVADRYFSNYQARKFNKDGSLRRNKSETAILRAGAPAGGLVAVVALAGSQFKVTTDDVLIVNRLNPVSKYCVGSVHTLTDEVLLVTCSSLTLVGMPRVEGAEVDVMVEEVTQDAKVIVYKKQGRKGAARKTGFRRDVTMLRILDIRLPEAYADEDYVVRPEPAPLVAA